MRYTLAVLALSVASVFAKPLDHANARRSAPPSTAADSTSTSTSTFTTSTSTASSIPSSAASSTSSTTTSITSSSTSTTNSILGSVKPSAIPSLRAVTATLYQNENKAFNAAPAPTAPTSGCAIVTQQLSTFIESFPATIESITFTSGLYCMCDQSVIAGTYVSTNDIGTKFIYCATATLTSGLGQLSSQPAAATVSPTMQPGNAYNPDWANVSCSKHFLPNAQSNVTLQWDEAGASAAYDAVVSAWNASGSGAQAAGFPIFLSNFFHGTVNFACQTIGYDGYCEAPVSCGQGSSANAVVDSPAAYIIMNSMENVHALFQNFYTDVQSAATIVDSQLGQFLAQFSVVEEQIEQTEAEQERERKFIEIFELVADLVVTSSFGFFLRLFRRTQSGVWGNLLSATGGVLTQEMNNVFNFIELSFEYKNIVYTQDALSQYASFVEQVWLNSTQNLASAIFTNPTAIGAMIAGGAYFTDIAPNTTAFSATQTLVQAFFSNIIVDAWSGGAAVGEPFILTSEGLPSPGTSCAEYDPFGNLPTSFAGSSFGYDTPQPNLGQDTCFEYGGSVYWLLSLSTNNNSLPPPLDPHPASIYTPHITAIKTHLNFTMPFGMETLNGTDLVFGGLDIVNITANAINTYNHYGGNNVTSILNPQQYSQILSLESADLTTAYGLVPIPVCSSQEVMAEIEANPSNAAGNPVWPCRNPNATASTSTTISHAVTASNSTISAVTASNSTIPAVPAAS